MESRTKKSVKKQQGYVKGRGLVDTKISAQKTKTKVDSGIKRGSK